MIQKLESFVKGNVFIKISWQFEKENFDSLDANLTKNSNTFSHF
jgi:hypothetical protein